MTNLKVQGVPQKLSEKEKKTFRKCGNTPDQRRIEDYFLLSNRYSCLTEGADIFNDLTHNLEPDTCKRRQQRGVNRDIQINLYRIIYII